MNFTPFALVEWQSKHEAMSEYCLADSGCQPARLIDVVPDPEELTTLLSYEQDYGGIAGSPNLRELIAEWQGAEADNILVTVGGTEANAITLDTLIEPSDHVVVIAPAYPQHLGCLLNKGANVDIAELDSNNDWSLHAKCLNDVIKPATRLIVISNPNTPTGTVLSSAEMDTLITAAQRVGAWLLVDEVHRGTEVKEELTPTFWGLYEKVVCISSMSKAFGLPGLRVGWVAAPPQLRERIERRHEYSTIATAKLSSHLAERALMAPVKQELLKRTKLIIRNGQLALRKWVAESNGLFSMANPTATAAGFVRYNLDIKSLEAAKIILEKSNVLVIPGIHFGVEHHLRITYGVPFERLNPALCRIYSTLNTERELRQG